MYFYDYNIALMGRKGSGKSTVAKMFINNDNYFTRVRFAGGIKDMIKVFLEGFCYDSIMIDRMIEGDLKETIIPELGVSPRHLMQTLGTEWGRLNVKQGVWGLQLHKQVEHIHNDLGNLFICDDARFNDEVEGLIDRYDTLFIRVVSDKEQVGDGHASEVLPTQKPDIIFLNEFGIDVEVCLADLADKLQELSNDSIFVIYKGCIYEVRTNVLKYDADKINFKQLKDLIETMIE